MPKFDPLKGEGLVLGGRMKMRQIFVCSIIFIGFLIFFNTHVRAQADMSGPHELAGPDFHFDVVNTAIPSDTAQSRLSVYIKVAYDDLQFIKVSDGYEAQYDVSVIVFDDNNDQVAGKEWFETVFVTRYNLTNSRNNFSSTNASLDFDPGEYKISIGVEDADTGKRRTEDTRIVLRDFYANKLTLSSITLVGDIKVDSLGMINVSPEVSDVRKGVQGNQFAYYEIYSSTPSEFVDIEYKVLNSSERIVLEDSYQKQITGFRTQDYFFLPIDSLANDDYSLNLKVIDGDYEDEIIKKFYVRWSGLPTTIKDLDTAIEQVRYIASGEEFRKIKNATETTERFNLFRQFWRRYDPTPGTTLNEAMEDHYARVQYANDNFAVMQLEGWQTDMGVLYIILGPPDDIERNPYPLGTRPYEIWYYYRINRRYTFYDYTGFGEYRLSEPLSIFDLQRLRRQ